MKGEFIAACRQEDQRAKAKEGRKFDKDFVMGGEGRVMGKER